MNQVIETALGGMNLIRTVEGRERYPVRLRYSRNLRERIDQLARLPVVTHSGAVVPLEELASLEATWGPAISSENARLVAHVSFSTNGSLGDLESVAAIEPNCMTLKCCRQMTRGTSQSRQVTRWKQWAVFATRSMPIVA